MDTRLVREWAVMAMALVGSALPAHAQTSRAVLDVPYVTQPANLCGGAALAMVLRYWGDRTVTARDFQRLVDGTQMGIRQTALAAAAIHRGWRTVLLPSQEAGGDGVAALAREIDRGRPPVVLIRIAPSTYHYVVVVAVTERDVIFHDPASRPFATRDREDFRAAWTDAGAWALIVLPGDIPASAPPRREVNIDRPGDIVEGRECATLIAAAIASSESGQPAAAERDLLAATARCPDSAAPWRELAGLRFLDARWDESLALAQRAVAIDPGDEHAWRIVAASYFMTDASLEALRAWNRADGPRVEAVLIQGAELTRQPVIADRLGIEPGEILTASRFELAARRAADLPAMTDASVRYVPEDDGGASVEVTLSEHSAFPRTAGLANIAGRALFYDQIRIPIGGLTGNGERLEVEYGWRPNRPSAAISLTAPAPGVLPGLLTFEWSRRQQTYSATGFPGANRIVENERQIRAGLEDWRSSRMHWNLAGALDRIDSATRVALGAGIDTRVLDDHGALRFSTTSWLGLGGASGFHVGSFSAHWRQRIPRAAGGWSAEAGLIAATRSAPLVVWPGADIGSNGAALLRAHALLTDGVVTSDLFGRRLAFASTSFERPIGTLAFGSIGIAAFLDGARVWRRMTASRPVGHVDAGVGLRIHGSPMGSLRLDFGWGVDDGAFAISAGFLHAWPGR